MRVTAWHSKKNPGKYHVCTNCTEGNNIEPGNRAPGKGGGTMCATCKRLSRKGEC